jgi:hypothetical protein
MEDVRLFRNSMPAVEVAKIGYRALQRSRPVVVAGLRNQLDVLSYQLAAPFLGLMRPAWLMAMGRRIMGRSNPDQNPRRSE